MSIFCDECGRNIATVFLTKVGGEEISNMQLCEECSRKLDETTEAANLIAMMPQLLSGMQNAVEGNLQDEVLTGEPVVCDGCGTSFNDFLKLGYLGCSMCYKVFGEMLDNVILDVQGAKSHCGKRPTKLSSEAKLRLRIAQLERKLRKRIEQEEYEAAAAVRDQIREIENLLKSGDREIEKE